MPEAKKITIPRARDAQILETLRSLSDEFGAKQASIQVPGLNESIGIDDDHKKGMLSDLVARDGHSISSANISFPGIGIAYKRDGARPGIFDTIEVSTVAERDREVLNDGTRLKIIGCLEERFNSVESALLEQNSGIEEKASYEAAHRSILERLVKAHADQAAKISEFNASLQKRFRRST